MQKYFKTVFFPVFAANLRSLFYFFHKKEKGTDFKITDLNSFRKLILFFVHLHAI